MSGKYIDAVIGKCKSSSLFPFNDWIDNRDSFHALINFWQDVFCAASGEAKENYKTLGEIRQNVDAYVFRVINESEAKKISVAPQNGDEVGAMFYLIVNWGESEDGSEDEYDLGFVGDLDRDRLLCFFHMIQHYVSTPIKDHNDLKAMNKMFVDRYGKYFGFENYNPFNSPLFPVTEIEDDDDEEPL